VFGVHGIGGLTGHAADRASFATAAIGGTAGLLEGNAGHCCVDAIAYGVAVVLAWTGGICHLRPAQDRRRAGGRSGSPHEQEVEGLDLTQHGEALQ
jgi:Amt family ammonium transporter